MWPEEEARVSKGLNGPLIEDNMAAPEEAGARGEEMAEGRQGSLMPPLGAGRELSGHLDGAPR